MEMFFAFPEDLGRYLESLPLHGASADLTSSIPSVPLSLRVSLVLSPCLKKKKNSRIEVDNMRVQLFYKPQVFSLFRVLQLSLQLVNFRTFSSPLKEILYPLGVISQSSHPLSPRQPRIYLPSLYICLFWTFYISVNMWPFMNGFFHSV